MNGASNLNESEGKLFHVYPMVFVLVALQDTLPPIIMEVKNECISNRSTGSLPFKYGHFPLA